LAELRYLADNFIKVGTFQTDIGKIKNLVHVFVAHVGERQSQKLDDTEDIEVMYRRPDEIDDMVKRNDIWNGITIAAWGLARHNFLEK